MTSSELDRMFLVFNRKPVVADATATTPAGADGAISEHDDSTARPPVAQDLQPPSSRHENAGGIADGARVEG